MLSLWTSFGVRESYFYKAGRNIEGAELNVLKGAKQTILRDKPKLAICIYHSDSEMLDIPEIAHGYELYVRQHAPYPFMFDSTACQGHKMASQLRKNFALSL